nr:hypothetical protein [Variovorax boronicumulans]
MANLFDPEPRRGFNRLPLVQQQLHFVSAEPALLRSHAKARGIWLADVFRRPLILPPQPNGIRMMVERELFQAVFTLRVSLTSRVCRPSWLVCRLG